MRQMQVEFANWGIRDERARKLAQTGFYLEGYELTKFYLDNDTLRQKLRIRVERPLNGKDEYENVVRGVRCSSS